MKAKDKDVLDAIDRSDLRMRSSLARWMKTNHDAFATRLAERSADWAVLARLFAEANLTDRRGNPPKPETARKIWQRVRKQVEQDRSRRPVPAQTQSHKALHKPAQQTRPATDPAGKTPTESKDILRVMAEMGAKSSKITDPLR